MTRTRVLLVAFLKFAMGPLPLHPQAVTVWLLRSWRFVAAPLALFAVALVRGGKESLELDPSHEPTFAIENGTIRTRALVLNPTRHAVTIERIEMTVADSLGTFTLRSETPPATVPPGYSIAIDLVASNFRPLRLSRRCLFRARFFSRSGCLCTFAHPFTNLWPAQYFDDDTRPIALDAVPFVQHHAAEVRSAIDRRYSEAGIPPA